MPTLPLTTDEAVAAVTSFPRTIFVLPAPHATNLRVVCAAVAADPRVFRDLPLALRDNRVVARHAIKQMSDVFRDVSPALRSDIPLVMQALRIDGLLLKYASPHLRNDPAIVEVAVKSCGEAILHAPLHLRRDKAIIAKAVEASPAALSYALIAHPGWVSDTLYYAGRDARGCAFGLLQRSGGWAIVGGPFAVPARVAQALWGLDGSDYSPSAHTMVQTCLKKIQEWTRANT